MDPNSGRSITTRHKMHYEVQERTTELIRRSGIDGKMMRLTESPKRDIGWSDACVRHLDHIAQIDISHTASHEQRGRYHNLIYLRGMDEDRQAPPLSTRSGYQEAKTALVEMQRQSRQDMHIVHILTKERTRLNDELDPEMRGYLEWLSTIGNSTSLLSGLQHPGGAHTRGLRTGMDGNSTADRKVSGQTRGDRGSNL